MELTHLNGKGRARMVDVTEKAETFRTALAEGSVRMSAETLELVRPAVALLPLGGGSGTGCARHLPGGELVAADLAEDVAGRVMGGAPGAENGGLGGGRVWIGGLGGPLLAVAVPVLVDTMSQAVVTRPVVRGAAIRADDDVILLLEGFAAHRAAVTSII